MKTYSRTKTLKNQLLVHTLCLALVLDGCRLEFEDLAEDLKLSAAETRALVRELVGCTCSASGLFSECTTGLVGFRGSDSSLSLSRRFNRL